MDRRPTHANRRLLVYEPQAPARGAAGETLFEGCLAFWCGSGAQANGLLDAMDFDCAAVSVSDREGLALLDRLRRTRCGIPVLVATGPEELEVRLRALSLGAVDYLIRPVDPAELRIRVATALRRTEGPADAPVRLGRLVLDPQSGRLSDGTAAIRLAPKELAALRLLLASPGRLVSRRALHNALADGQGLSDNAVDVIVFRLRAKVAPWGMPITTCRGKGYLLDLPRDTPEP